MRNLMKSAAAIAITGALALAAASPASAQRWHRHGWHHHNDAAIAAGIGLTAGALLGAAASQPYYGDDYYAYAPSGPVYAGPQPSPYAYYGPDNSCTKNLGYGRTTNVCGY